MIRRLRHLLVFPSLALLLVRLAAEEPGEPPPVFRAWTQQNGLPTNEVTGLSRSRSGYLFIGTPNGVVRFDGLRFTPVMHTNATAQNDRGITAFASIPASDDVLAAPRLGGLLRLSGDDFSEQALPARFAKTPIEALFFENDITLWIGFKGGVAVRRQAGRVEVFDTSDGLRANDSVQFARDGGGAVWLASGSFVARYDAGRLVRVPLPGTQEKQQVRIASSRREGPWLVIDGRVCQYTAGQFNQLATLRGSTGAYYIQALLEDSEGALWIGTRSLGLHRLTPAGELRRVREAPDDISALLEDAVGNVWIGATSGGILRVKAGVLHVLDRTDGLVENRSLTFCRDESDTLWLANRDGGIYYADRLGRLVQFEPTSGWDNFSAYVVSPAQGGGVWATTTRGLLRITRDKIQARYAPEFLTDQAAPRIALSARNGDFWMALNEGGLARARGTKVSRLGPAEGLGSSSIRTLAEDAAGAIWAGTDEATLYRLGEDGLFHEVELGGATKNAGAIQALHFDEGGVVWIGTEKSGLLRLTKDRLQNIDTHAGLESANITHILPDRNGVLWFGSPGAIFHVRRDELDRVLQGTMDRFHPVVLGPDEGVREVTCSSEYQPSIGRTEDGRLWFATRQGVLAIDPERERKAPERLRAKITHLSVDGRLQKAAPILEVPAGTHGLEICFSAPNLSTPERVRLRYRLVGYDEGWTDGTKEGMAKYLRLPPGSYRFELVAALAGAPGAESGDSMSVQMQAAWWQTGWFLGAITALAVGAIILMVRQLSHRRLHRKLARLEKESALERERTRIARNIHDELGAGLTRISLLTQSGHDKATSQLGRIYDVVGGLIQAMDEIVWAVNPTNDDLENFANYLTEYAQGYLSDAGLRCRVRIPQALPPVAISAQFRHHLFLACKEALHNVVKHAHAKDVSIEIDVRNEKLVIEIADNGTGLPAGSADAAPQRNGLRTMEARLREIGGTMNLSPGREQGTSVTFSARLKPSP